MAKLIYSAFTSLDGYMSDEAGNFECAEPHSCSPLCDNDD